jgi:hypothetical protein
MDDAIGISCRTHGINNKYKFLIENRKESKTLEDSVVDWWIILTCILYEYF